MHTDAAWLDVFVFAGGTIIAWLLLTHWNKANAEVDADITVSLFPTSDQSIAQQPFPRFELWFRRQVLLARVPLPIQALPILMIAGAATFATMTFVATEDMLAALLVGILVVVAGLVLVVGVAHWKVRQFQQQMPLALDLMAGAVAAGDSLSEAVALLATTLQEPARTEFRRCKNQMEMGLSLRSVMQSLAGRIGTIEVRLLSATLAVHRDTGGQLAETLKRMAKVIRARFDYERHLKTATGIGRISALVVVVLAWLLFGYLLIIKPEYGRPLLEQPLGQQMLLAALGLEVLGILWVLALVRSRY